jgi:PhnB protein
MKCIVYLFFNGNCEEAINFYAAALGGTIESIQRYADNPIPGVEVDGNKVMHAVLQADGFKLMFSDTNDKPVTFGTNYSISLDFSTEESIQRVFDNISAGGQVTMPLQDTFWGAKFGMCIDNFGVNWMFNHDKE